jgi:hypothetical protein
MAKKKVKGNNIKKNVSSILPEDMKQTHGKTKDQVTSLAQLWGEVDTQKYGTNDASEYERQLNEMNMSDLYAHAANLGIRPTDSRDRLTRTLINEFLGHVSSFHRPTPTGPKRVSKNVMNIVREGE